MRSTNTYRKLSLATLVGRREQIVSILDTRTYSVGTYNFYKILLAAYNKAIENKRKRISALKSIAKTV